VQATTTFQGAEREIVSLENDSRLARFAHKIRHIIVDDLPRGTTPWFAEYAQRNRLGRAVLEQAGPNDLVILSDVDEVPTRQAVEEARKIEWGQVGGFDMRFLYYGLNWELPTRWDRARVFRASTLNYISAQEVRLCPADVKIGKAGWHLSYFYRRRELIDQIKAKAASFAHTEYSQGEYVSPRYLELCIRGGLSWCTSPKYLVKLRFHDMEGEYAEQFGVEADLWNEYYIKQEERDRAAEAKARALNWAALGWKALGAPLRARG
jgi:beta-1,4-mannosyl-glycoprotein beta-1,4-N-acetylglucosaminyltransferase